MLFEVKLGQHILERIGLILRPKLRKTENP